MDSKEALSQGQEVIMVKRIYVKTSTFESAALTEDLILKNFAPAMDVQFQVNHSARENDTHEVVVTLVVTAKHEGNLLWRIQWQQAGLYQLKDFKDNDREFVMHNFCANQLYQHASVHVNTAVQQGGFPAVILMPLDFGRLYQDRQKEIAEEKMKAEPLGMMN